MNARQSPGKNRYKYRQQYAVIVVCPTELHQVKTYNRLKRMGYKLKVVTV